MFAAPADLTHGDPFGHVWWSFPKLMDSTAYLGSPAASSGDRWQPYSIAPSRGHIISRQQKMQIKTRVTFEMALSVVTLGGSETRSKV